MVSVLIVDDHALFRAGLRSRLELEHDITPVGEAATAEEAVQQGPFATARPGPAGPAAAGNERPRGDPGTYRRSRRGRGCWSSPPRPPPARCGRRCRRAPPDMSPSAHPTKSWSRPSGRWRPVRDTSTLIWAPSWWCRIGQRRWSHCLSGSATSCSCSRSGIPIRRSVGSATSRCAPWIPIAPTSCESWGSRHVPSWCCSPSRTG